MAFLLRSHLIRRAVCVGTALGAATICLLGDPAIAQTPATAPDSVIPLPENPRPDFERAQWLNLNGRWHFRFDQQNEGEKAGWYGAALVSTHSILVPFSWGAPLSGVPDSADIGWYDRTIRVPASWRGKRVFLVVGASDWRTSAWLDGKKLGDHQGGYTPFSMELTSTTKFGSEQRLTMRVDDSPHAFKLEGKQGYGKARGMWQTVYLEARGGDPLQYVHFTPDIHTGRVSVDARLLEPAPQPMTLRIAFRNGDTLTAGGVTLPSVVIQHLARGASSARFDIAIPDARLWSPDDPFLYQVAVTAEGAGIAKDSVDTYFGMREISVVDLPGTSIPYVAINGKPVYLQLALDQSYHPEGFYTFPTDSILRNEIIHARQLGLTGVREHIKIEAPRKLYWADKLGLLIMADVPNWWGPPDSVAFHEHDYALSEMIERDYNHPSIFSWIMYNETWGLTSKVNGKDVYLPATQRRVIQSVQLAKRLDPTRLVEDNSPCCGWGHTVTDINSWHDYLAGWEWQDHLDMVSDSTNPGSPWNFEHGYVQAHQPMMNSEFGDVWGYNGSTGDVDWSWDYHLAVNAFRMHPKLAGWLYTELDDVINEWNGYLRADRTSKETGLGDLVPGMTIRDLNSPMYIAVGSATVMATSVHAGESVQVPLYASFMSGSHAYGDSLTLRFDLYGWNALGEKETYSTSTRQIPYRPWMSESLAPLTIKMPNERSVAVLAVRLEDMAGKVLQRNFTTFVVDAAVPSVVRLEDGRKARIVSVGATSYTKAHWSQKSWNVLDSLKADGAGAGFFEYRIPWPRDLKLSDVRETEFIVEASAKQLFGKDRDSTVRDNGDYMRGGGLQDPSRNRNAYPMTDERLFPSAVTVRVNGEVAGRYDLRDDPADHRGILSWYSQKRDKYLREAGSYGQLITVPIPASAIERAARSGQLVIRLEVSEAMPGGLAIYGAHFGRYPVDPTVAFVLRGDSH